MSRVYPIEVRHQVQRWDLGPFVIRDQPGAEAFALWNERPGLIPVLVAVCRGAKALSSWAFGKGASEIRHDYDATKVDPSRLW